MQQSARIHDINVQVKRLVALSLLQDLVQRVEELRIVTPIAEYLRELTVVQARQIANLFLEASHHSALVTSLFGLQRSDLPFLPNPTQPRSIS
jgi:hypothetical protein